MPADLTVRPVSDAQAPSASALASRAAPARKTGDAAQKFEAFVLQSFIQEMMPETQESVFGAGISGDFWKSMMAEKIADQVAARGNIGIADTIRAGHAVPVRPGGFNPLDVMSHTTATNDVAGMLDVKPVNGE
ncbi:rod-binding protein [uncultured Hyphomicrobium sp.]|uniref:rod-binding protein n=1 Tax=uncultured Hyphomicrobium sp. TaxID=194373 RepID=UPI0025F5CE74|nr:rod-binding protein [uncultured Hyphomicrobium sp.]